MKLLFPYSRARIAVAAALVLAAFPMVSGIPARAEEGSIFEVSTEQVAGTVDNYFQQVDSAIANGDIRTAKQKLSFIDFKIQKHKDIISKNDKKSYTARIAAQNASIKRIIDSLVQVNLTMISKNGRTAGIEFRQQLTARGLTEAQLAPVDDAIINASMSEEKPREPIKAEVQPEPVRAPQPRPQEPAVLPPKRETPPEKVQPPPPSVEARIPETPAAPPEKETWRLPETALPAPENAPTPAESLAKWPEQESQLQPSLPLFVAPPDSDFQKGKALAASNAAKVTALINQGTLEEAMTVFQLYRTNMERFLSNLDFEKLRLAVETAYNQDQDRRVQAARLLRTIEDLMAQDRSTEAFDRLHAQRDLLRQYLDKDEFARLEEKVGRASVSFGRAQAAAQARAREIRMLLASNTNDAITAFDLSLDELKRYLPKDAFQDLSKEVTSAVDAIRDKKKRSQLCRRDILDLIEEGKGAAAFACLTENKSLLEHYLDGSSFASLAAAATSANSEYFMRQTKAQSELHRIDSLIAARQIEQARERFYLLKDTLRNDLNDDRRFFDLKDRVATAYDDFTKKKKKALRSVKRINSLINRKEGREANLTFLQDADLIKEFLEGGAFSKLETAVKNSLAEYEANVAAARKTAADIEKLMKQKRFEQAYNAFKEARETFDHYLEKDEAIAVLERKTDSLYTVFRKHKRWAADMIDEIHWFIDQDQGNQAMALLEKVKPELAIYLETPELASLDSATTKANNQYLAAKALAGKNALRLQGLLDKKRFEEAYLLFKELRSTLERYLTETTFTNLRNEVTNAYEEYQEKKRRAEDYAGELKDLAWNKKLKEAQRGFRLNQKSLKQYLDAQSYAELEKTVRGPAKKPSVKSRSRK